jgi:hypothetical protein
MCKFIRLDFLFPLPSSVPSDTRPSGLQPLLNVIYKLDKFQSGFDTVSMFFILEKCTEIVFQASTIFLCQLILEVLPRSCPFFSNAASGFLSVTRQLPSHAPCVTDFFTCNMIACILTSHCSPSFCDSPRGPHKFTLASSPVPHTYARILTLRMQAIQKIPPQ